jgi:hypothetical protein
VNLSWRLGGVIRGALDPKVLDGYSAERRRAVERVSVNTQRQTEWGLLDTPAKITVRNVLVRLAKRAGVLQRYGAPLMSQTDVDYGPPRPIWRRDLRPGMRFPAFAGGGTGWPAADPDAATLLLWPGEEPEEDWPDHVAAIRAAVGTAVAVRDVSDVDTLRPVLGRRPAGVLVRPDGHVAALLDPTWPVSPALVVRRAGFRLDCPRPAAARVEVMA